MRLLNFLAAVHFSASVVLQVVFGCLAKGDKSHFVLPSRPPFTFQFLSASIFPAPTFRRLLCGDFPPGYPGARALPPEFLGFRHV